MINIVYGISYIIVGLTVFWLLSKMDRHYMLKLMRIDDKNRDLSFTHWKKYERMTRVSTENVSNFKFVLCCILAAVIVAVWPVVTVACLVWYPIAYKLAIK